ncbi:hypothetical protein [Hyphomicrobium sp. DY-1]|uniref:hypothetical protein n=1 Tax=Hyphomicrobium sp. DY-1 TaxID=3075650 RepID=UPI0039C19BD9
MKLHAAVALLMLSMPFSASAEGAVWTCKPVWRFSGMGEKTYEGSSTSETAAKEAARNACALDNRELELDDFCLPDPDKGDWHCSQGAQQANESKHAN